MTTRAPASRASSGDPSSDPLSATTTSPGICRASSTEAARATHSSIVPASFRQGMTTDTRGEGSEEGPGRGLRCRSIVLTTARGKNAGNSPESRSSGAESLAAGLPAPTQREDVAAAARGEAGGHREVADGLDGDGLDALELVRADRGEGARLGPFRVDLHQVDPAVAGEDLVQHVGDRAAGDGDRPPS